MSKDNMPKSSEGAPFMLDVTPQTPPLTPPAGNNAMTPEQSDIDEILDKVITRETHKGSVNRVRHQTKQALYKAMLEVIGDTIEYDKYGKCPLCGAEYMYRCTCDNASEKTITSQRERLNQLFGRGE